MHNKELKVRCRRNLGEDAYTHTDSLRKREPFWSWIKWINEWNGAECKESFLAGLGVATPRLVTLYTAVVCLNTFLQKESI